MKKLSSLLFGAISPQKRYVEFSYAHSDFELALDHVNLLVRDGWQLTSIKCQYQQGTCCQLPPEAFDGEPVSATLKRLQQEWEQLLHSTS